MMGNEELAQEALKYLDLGQKFENEKKFRKSYRELRISSKLS